MSRPYFFLHVMKTAGSSFTRHIRANFPGHQRYPNREDPAGAYWHLVHLRALSPERRADVRLYQGHFPYFATSTVGNPIVLTILREPVERTLSWLRREREVHHPDRSLEEIYGIELKRRRFVVDHMTKVFSLRDDDSPNTYMQVIELDRSRLDAARANLDRCDLVGIQERFDEFVQVVCDRYGWTRGERAHEKQTQQVPVSDALLERIEQDTQLDCQLYQHARARWEATV